MAYIPATYNFSVGSYTEEKKSNVSVIFKDKLIEKVLTEGELVPAQSGGGDYWELEILNDDITYSFNQFWATITAALDIDIGSNTYELFVLNREANVKSTSAYQFFRTGGFKMTPIDNPSDRVNASYTITSSVHPDRELGRGGLDSSDDHFEFGANGENVAFRTSVSPDVFEINHLYKYGRIRYFVYSRELVENGRINLDAGSAPTVAQVDINFTVDDEDFTSVHNVNIMVHVGSITQMGDNYNPYPMNNLKLSNYDASDIDDVYNPFLPGGDNSPYGWPGSTEGGDGKFDNSTEQVDLTDLPEIGSVNCGIFTAYSTTLAELRQLAQYLVSDAFSLNSFKKLWADPMQAILGLVCIPVAPFIGGRHDVTLGGVYAGVSMSVVERQFKEVECGSVTIDKYWGNFADYEPYTKVEIYLPFIGTRELSPAEVMGKTISLKYRVDVITGACVAIINVSGLGAIYQFTGSCATNMPLAANDFSQAINNAISAIGTFGHIATAGTFAAVGDGMKSLASTVASPKEHISHVGNSAGSGGLMGHKNAYVIITRPKQSVPKALPAISGLAASYSSVIGNLKGFTMCEDMHLENIPCTDAERQEIESLLKKGVII